MKSILFALGLFFVTPAFAEVPSKEAPKAVNQEETKSAKIEAKQKNEEGLALLKQKKFSEAQDLFREATNLDPDNAHYHNHYGLSLLKDGDPYTAAEEFQVAIDLGLNTAFIWNNLGMAYEHTNQLDEARKAYKRASQKGDESAEKNYQRIKNVKSLRSGLQSEC
jgi:Flp pilus assembly protein TadD